MAKGPSIPDPNVAAMQGTIADAQNYPFEYIINALSQMGGTGTVNGQTYDFTGLGNADVQSQLSDQMAQTLLDIQNGLGPQYVAQRLADLQQSDPLGYAARGQLFNQILQEANQAAPNAALSQSTQDAISAELQKGATLDPKETQQVQQQVRGQQVANGLYLGNAAQQAEADAVVQAGDQQQAARQGAASQYLQSGVTPSDIQYRKIQQDMANLGAFLSDTTPTAQFSSLSGAQSQAAPTPNTGYSPVTPNPNAAQQGINNSLGIYSGEINWADNNVNPYMAGLSTATQGLSTAFNLGYSPWNTGSTTYGSGYTGTTQSFPGGTYVGIDQPLDFGTPGESGLAYTPPGGASEFP